MDIRIRNLTHEYPGADVPALDGLDLEIRHGTFGLLGPNGAGKTTLIRILSTQMRPSSGSVTIGGLDIDADRDAVRRRLGYLPQHFGAYPQLTAWEFLDYMARLAGIHGGSARGERVGRALEDVGLYDVRRQRAGTFSGGMTRRLGIAQAILSDPDFLIVDEPTVGLDPEERIRFRSVLGRLSRDRAILISTHIVGDISSTCEDIALLDHGRLLYHGGPEELVGRAQGHTWQLHVDDAGFAEVSRRYHVVTVAPDGDGLSVRLVGEEPPGREAEEVPPSLEDAYVWFMAAEGRIEADDAASLGVVAEASAEAAAGAHAEGAAP